MFYRRAPNPKGRTRLQQLLRNLKIIVKCIAMLLVPIPVAAAAGWLWYRYIFLKDIHFKQEAEVILTAAWIPIFGILYALLTAVVAGTVWREYKTIRIAVKKYDLDTFVDLRDESISPLVHTLMGVLSLAVLAGFMGLKYPDLVSGLTVIASTSYLLALFLFVIVEIDDPCSGFWFIKNIPEEWLLINIQKYRVKRAKEQRKHHGRNHSYPPDED